MATLQELYEAEGVRKELKLYIDDSTEPIDNKYVHQESSSLNRSICTQENLRFGGCLSAYISLRLSNEFGKLKGKKITVKQLVADEEVKLGQFYVDTDTPSTDKKYRDITAYDILYTKKMIDVSDWYSRLVFPMTQKKFRDLFFKYIGIEQVDIILPNDDVPLVKNPSATGIYASAIMYDICQMNGALGRINEDGLFDYVFLRKDNPIEIGKNLQKKLSYEDYITHDINQLKFTQPNMDADFYYGGGDNQYPISMTILCVSTDTSTLDTVCSNIYPYLEGIKYTPIDISTRGNLLIYPGEYIKTYGYGGEELYTYALQQSFSFESLENITGEYISYGTEYYTRDVGSNSEAIYDIDKEIQTIYRNNFYSYTFTNVEKIIVTTNEQTIIHYNISATAKTDVVFLAMIPIKMECDARIVISYYVDAVLKESDTVSVLLSSGEQIISLTNFIPMKENGRLTLTVSIRMEYEETIDRVQTANIVSLTDYVKTGTYNEPSIDTTLVDATIAIESIKSVVFAKGLSGDTPWDGTLNLVDSVTRFMVTENQVSLSAVGDILSCSLIPNTSEEIEEIIPVFSITSPSISLDIYDTAIIYGTVYWYIIDTSTREICTYNRDYVISDVDFEFNTIYNYVGSEDIIDEGTLQVITLDFTQFNEVLEVVSTVE